MALSRGVWHVSTRSGGSGNCVEVLAGDDAVLVRDTKDRDGGTLRLRPVAWVGLLAGIRNGEFNRP